MIRFLTCSSVLLAVVVAQFSCVIGHAAMVHGYGFNEGQGITVTDSVSAVQGVFGSDKNPATDWVTLEFTSARNALSSASMNWSGNRLTLNVPDFNPTLVLLE